MMLAWAAGSCAQQAPADVPNAASQSNTVDQPKKVDAKQTKEPESSASGTVNQTPTPVTTAAKPKTENATIGDVDTKISDALNAQDKHPEFELSLGIGSLVNGHGHTDYTNNSNTLQSTNLGRSTPQYLVGVSLRTPYPNFGKFGHSKTDCTTKPKEGVTDHGPYIGDPYCAYWRVNPWKAFINLKFASGSSQTLSGFVLGGSYQFGHYVDALVGFGITPFNEPSQGLRTTASQFVTAQQALGNYLNFNPAAMLAGSQNAFDGFSLTDTTGKLIYKGTPLEVHYRGGVVLGVSIPVNLGSVFTSKTP